MKMKQEHKIILSSIAAGLLLCAVDAVGDSSLAAPESFWESLAHEMSVPRLYSRLVLLSGFIFFGFMISRSISKSRQFEERVREELHKAAARSENEKKRSEAIIAAGGDGISIQDSSFKVLYQNQTQRELTGGDRTGEYCYRAYARRDTVCPDCPADATFKDGMMHTTEKTVHWNDKSLTVEIKASPLLDAGGKMTAVIEAVRDVTERRKAEELLMLFSEALEEAVDGIQIADLDGSIVYSNKAVGEIYGFAPRELTGKRVNDMNADKEFADDVILPRIKESGRWNGELMVVHKSGRVFPVLLSASLVKDAQGKPIAIVGIIRDITEHKEAEEILKRNHEQLTKLVEERTAELTLANEKLRKEIADREKMEEELLKAQKLESLGILAGGIAHDFNNLLATILGNISLAILDLNPDNDAYRQLEGAEKASLRAQDLTRQLLTFSKGGAPVKKTMSIAELVQEAAGFALRGARVKCELFIPPDLWCADVDAGQVSRVIHNLVINADHAMPAGGTITIWCENVTIDEALEPSPSLYPGDYVKISVHDHGVGISKKHLSKIFDPYFTTKQKGSGLGLATSYSIVKKHGGHIVAESQPDKGTTFTLFLPASRTARRTKKTNEAPLLTGTGKILLMDDEEDIRQTTGEMIRRLGYTVELAADGARAIDLYQKARGAAPFDAVIMDLTVPGGMGGHETLGKLREIDPDIRAIVSSGYSNDPIMAYYKKYGFNGAVAKPYRIKDLGEALHTVLRSNMSGPTQDQ